MNKYDPQIEREPLSTIKKFQEEKLADLLQYLNKYSVYYKRLFQQENIDISKIKKLEDLKYIPVTIKENLQVYNKDFICVEKDKIIDYITTSGTLSTPTTFAMTEKDLQRLAYNEAISFTCADNCPGDVYQLMVTLDKRFMAGFAYMLGIRMLGNGFIRVGNGIPELQWDTINRISPDAIVCVPSFIMKIIQYAEEHGIDYRNSSIKRAVCIGENLRNEDYSLSTLGAKIHEKWGIKLYSTYASTEMGTSFCECGAGKGGHHHPELIICELLDVNDNVVHEGEPGELTVTTLGVEGMPLLRFKTGDMACFHYEPCSCGRTSMRISPILGRKKQMIKLKGTTLYPAAIYDVLNNIDYVESYVVEVSTNELGTDALTVYVGCREKGDEIIKEMKDSFRAKLRVAPEIIVKSVEEVRNIEYPEMSRKPVRFVDKRVKNYE